MENLATHLRLSVTELCNIQCFYCHHEGQVCSGEDMSLSTILAIVSDMAKLGVKHVKITGGEPLVRSDIVEIVKGIKTNPEIIDLSMTTNGLLLEKLAKPLKEAGLDRINIGCDSIYSDMVPKTMQRILPGIQAATEANLGPIKVNVVILKGINDSEIPEMIEYARTFKFILQLIELIPMGVEKFDHYFVSLKDLEKELEQKAIHIHTRSLQARKQYDLEGVIVEVVGPSKHDFCANCKKIRVTSDGMIKPCLMRDDNLIPYTGIESIRKALGRRTPYQNEHD